MAKFSLLTHTFVASFSLLLTFQIQKNKLKKKNFCVKKGAKSTNLEK